MTTLTFKPHPTAELGKDHNGLYVLADADGQGTYTIHPPHPETIHAEIDEVPTKNITTTGSFQSSLRLLFTAPFQTTVTINLTQPDIPDDHQIQLIDQFSIADLQALEQRDWQVQNMSEVRELTSTFPDGTKHTAPKASHLNRGSWTTPIPQDNHGLILQKTFDRFHGRQRARVLIDTTPVGWWSDPWQDRTNRWATLLFLVPPPFTQSKEQVRITVDPPAGVPLWDVSTYEIFAILPSSP